MGKYFLTGCRKELVGNLYFGMKSAFFALIS